MILNQNTFYVAAYKLAIIHVIVIPILLLIFTNFIDKQFALIVPIAYLCFMSFFHYARLNFAYSEFNKLKSTEFFQTLSYVALFLILAAIFAIAIVL